MKVLEQRSGRASHIIMHGPNGEVSDGVGVFLEAVPEERLVFTNAYRSGWIPSVPPSETPLRTMIIEMSREENNKTRYVARALHWTEQARKQHEDTGFHEGWEQTSHQLEALARML